MGNKTKAKKEEPEVDLEDFSEEEPVGSTRFTIRQTNQFYQIFRKIKVLATIYACILYPYYANFGISEVGSAQFFIICFVEGVLLVDIILNFFLQPLQEDG